MNKYCVKFIFVLSCIWMEKKGFEIIFIILFYLIIELSRVLYIIFVVLKFCGYKCIYNIFDI